VIFPRQQINSKLTYPIIFISSAVCSPNIINGQTCAFVTITTEVSTNLSTDGLGNEIGDTIGFVINNQQFIAGLNDEVESCNGTIEPTLVPTWVPTTLPSTVVYGFSFDIEYSITCITDYMQNEMEKALDVLSLQYQSIEINPSVVDIRKYLPNA
jgi:hypothetical protein